MMGYTNWINWFPCQLQSRGTRRPTSFGDESHLCAFKVWRIPMSPLGCQPSLNTWTLPPLSWSCGIWAAFLMGAANLRWASSLDLLLEQLDCSKIVFSKPDLLRCGCGLDLPYVVLFNIANGSATGFFDPSAVRQVWRLCSTWRRAEWFAATGLSPGKHLARIMHGIIWQSSTSTPEIYG